MLCSAGSDAVFCRHQPREVRQPGGVVMGEEGRMTPDWCCVLLPLMLGRHRRILPTLLLNMVFEYYLADEHVISL